MSKLQRLVRYGTCLNKQEEVIWKRNIPQDENQRRRKNIHVYPTLFRSRFYRQYRHHLSKPNNSHKLDIMVDGGITANYPIFLFDTIVEGQRIENPHTLGIKDRTKGTN